LTPTHSPGQSIAKQTFRSSANIGSRNVTDVRGLFVISCFLIFEAYFFRVDRQRGASKARLRPGFISGGGTRHLSQAADFSDTERVVYHPGL
jgi:hypothetical protein